jgi:RNA polymerase sigma-70 factor, ECF subfamily
MTRDSLTQLRRLADGYLRRERPDHTLQPTALVHEAYVRPVGQDQPDYRTRAHFFGAAAQLMRQILVDHARTRNAGKRGGGEQDPRKARVIEMRFFGGLTAEETAEILGISVETMRRDLRSGQAFLQREQTRLPEMKGSTVD